MNPASPTPRTDEFRRAQCEDDNCPAQISAIDFARQLERELSEKTNEVARLRDELKKARKRIKDLTPCGCDNYLQITCKKHSK